MSKKYVMVLDLDRCIGCYTCVVACKMAYGTKPGVDYNGVQIIEWGNYPDPDWSQRYLLTMCMHCDDPSCVSICPTDASYKAEDGMVAIDYDKCIGCAYCVSACPYGQRHIVRDDATNYKGAVAPYEEQSYGRINVSEKCTFCSGRVANGEVPMCTMHCPGQCRIFGDINDPESQVSQYINKRGAVNIPGTSIYYVLPEGMDPAALPAAYERPAFVGAKQVGTTIGKIAVGASAIAIAAGVIGTRKGGKNDGE